MSDHGPSAIDVPVEGAARDVTGTSGPAPTSQRLPAFIPHPGDEGMFDTLGFWNWGIVRGEWSGTTVWLADALLPEAFVVRAMVRPLPVGLPVLAFVREQVANGLTTPVVLLAPVDLGGMPVLPIQGTEFDVNPNFVAHIARTLPGGEWHITEPYGVEPAPMLAWVIDGTARAMVRPLGRNP